MHPFCGGKRYGEQLHGTLWFMVKTHRKNDVVGEVGWLVVSTDHMGNCTKNGDAYSTYQHQLRNVGKLPGIEWMVETLKELKPHMVSCKISRTSISWLIWQEIQWRSTCEAKNGWYCPTIQGTPYEFVSNIVESHCAQKNARFFSKMNTSTLGGQSLIICFRGQIYASIYIFIGIHNINYIARKNIQQSWNILIYWIG